ncbi:MAG: NUDIX hydrolase [Thermoproteota archaeon]|nr:NUDIX hydrolase [Thermoproteota archaeon]
MNKYHYPSVAVDIILEKDDNLLLVLRKKDPFKGSLAIPGGFVNEGERVEDAARREMLEETNLNTELIDILGVYSAPNRDPRGHVVSIVFIAKIISGNVTAGDDADSFEWLSTADLIKNRRVAFDHIKIIEDYREWKTSKGTFWSSKECE